MKEYYLKKAEENLTPLKSEKIELAHEASVLNTGDTVTLDMGNHYQTVDQKRSYQGKSRGMDAFGLQSVWERENFF